MKIEITREELQLIRKALNFLKKDNKNLIEMCKEVCWTEINSWLEKENIEVSELSEKLSIIAYGKQD